MALPIALHFESRDLPRETEYLRHDVRDFIKQTMPSNFRPNSDFGTNANPDFSLKLGQRGWLGMTWPKEYGGAEKSFLDRYVVTEELLAAGAPVGSHWIADRQTGPLLLKYGTKEQCKFFLPRIARGEIFFSIGMSEPDCGSDLASIRTKAKKIAGGWQINGRKLWTSEGHRNHYMITLVRTDPGSTRNSGLSQLLVDLNDPQIERRPIRNIAGDEDFSEIVFDDVFVADDRLIGKEGNGWQQVVSELGYERSGPERFLSAFRVIVEFVRVVGPEPEHRTAVLIGKMVAHLMTLRRLSISVAVMLESAKNSPITQAALVKDLGNCFEQLVPEWIRLCIDPKTSSKVLRKTLFDTILHAPSFSIRGGTREILRGMIARGLGLR